MSTLMHFGVGLYIFALVCIGLIAAIVGGYASYVGINNLIDWRQGVVRRRRHMATPMTREELHAKRQNDAAARRLEIRVIDGWARK